MKPAQKSNPLFEIAKEIIECRRCGRLITYCRQVGKTRKKAFRNQDYWARPVPSFGSPDARLLVIGLAPAAHGGNRTGRIFTGDSSGDFLFDTLYRFGFSNQAESVHAGDGLYLMDAYITAVIHCAPPGNKPLPGEIENCRIYLKRELEALTRLGAVLALGKIAFSQYIALLKSSGKIEKTLRVPFVHGGFYPFKNGLPALFSSYHPSQQNTRTGRLTRKMFDDVLSKIRLYLTQSDAP